MTTPGNAPPVPSIESPATNYEFKVGEDVTLSGKATDAEDSDEPELRWEVLQHHNDSHAHPYDSGTGNTLTIQGPAPEDTESTGRGNYLELRLTAVDDAGQRKTVSQKLEPRRVDLRFETDPTGLNLEINGGEHPAPYTFTSWAGYKLNVNAPDQKTSGDEGVGDALWSDGKSAARTITTPEIPTTYTAAFKKVPVLTVSASSNLVPYKGTVVLTGNLAYGEPLDGSQTITLWSSTDGGANWSEDGAVEYDANSGSYKAERSLERNTLFQMRQAGDGEYGKSDSEALTVKARARLSRPSVGDNPRKEQRFEVSGYLRPYHEGKTRLVFFQRKNGEWRRFKTVYAANNEYEGYTKYVRSYKVPYTGWWYVKAYHKDESHAATQSPRRMFKVRR